jgi:carbonic anhydrase
MVRTGTAQEVRKRIMQGTKNFSRRTLLRHLTVGGLAACPICSAATKAFAGEAHHSAAGGAPHWTYEGSTGPEHWGELTPEFRSCSLGMEQTPIDIDSAIRAETGQLDIAFVPVPGKVINNGHTIQVNCGPGSHSVIAGTRYDLLQFHFHHPSEHLLSGKAFQMECHFVHKSAAGALAVVGVFINPGATNRALAPVWDVMPAVAGGEATLAGSFDPAALLPDQRSYYRYAGSLTTPPCSEGITWTVFGAPIEASTAQITKFAALFPNNARPVQGRNRRFLLESF